MRAIRSRKLASHMISRAPKGRSKVTNGQQLFIEGDARLKISRRFRDVLASIVTDLGGVERLSEGQKQMARRCAMLSVECEKMESAAVAGLPFDVDRLWPAHGSAWSRLPAAWPQAGRARRDAGPGRLSDRYGRREGPGRPRRDRRLRYGFRSRNGRQRPTSSIGEHDAFRHHAPGPERQASLGRRVGRRQLAGLAHLAHRRHGRGFDGRRTSDLRQAYGPRARAGRAGRRIVVRHRTTRRQIESHCGAAGLSRDHGRLSRPAGFWRARRRVVPGSDARAGAGGARVCRRHHR